MEECFSCGHPLDGGMLTLPWEDGDNRYAYITCPHCGHDNILEGLGEDED